MPSDRTVNLVLVYTRGGLDVGDYHKIADAARATSDAITVHIHEDRKPDEAMIAELARHPTFVFSPCHLLHFHVTRGRAYAGRPMRKSEQLLRLELAGVPVPRWTMFDRGKRFDPGLWGDYVVVKPDIGSGARGVMIAETRNLNERSGSLPAFTRNGEALIVQRLVRNKHHGKTRIETLFDVVLFARQFHFPEVQSLDTIEGLRAYQDLFRTAGSKADWYESPEVFDLACRCFAAFDGAPLLGLDVLFDEDEKPYFIEANPGGNTWHFSSNMTGRELRARGTFLEEQFDGFVLAGRTLARRALAEAL